MDLLRHGPISYLGARAENSFTPAVIAGGLVYVSGQASVNLQTGAVVSGTFEEEMRRSVSNLEAILHEAGSSLRSVLRINAFVARESDLAEYNVLYRELFAHPRPARTTFVSPIDLVQVELDAVALVEREI